MELLLILSLFFVAAVVCMIVKRRAVIEWTSVSVAALGLGGSFMIALEVADRGVYTAVQFFSVDALGAIVMCIIAFVGLAAVVYSIQYLREETAKNIIGFTRVKQFYILLNLFLVAMFLAITASSPIFAWIAVEATTLSTAFLISFYNKPTSMEAAWKYLVINSVGLLLGFFGTLLYFTSIDATSGNGFVSWQSLGAGTLYFDPLIAKIAFIFVLIGYGTKVGFAPMHTWLPDAHSKAPAPISALLSGVLLNVAFVMILRFKILTDMTIGPDFSQNLLIFFGVLSILVAALIITTQKNYKRLLAYSSIENMGIIALGFGFGSIGIFSALLHMIYHALVKSALFLSAGTIFLRYSSTKILNIRGVLSALPIAGALFLIGVFAIAGAPPFGIFLVKVSILSVGIHSHPGVTVFVIGLIAMLFYGFLKIASRMVFGERPQEIIAGKESALLFLPPLVLIAVALTLSFYFPPFLQTLIHDAVAQYSL